MGGLAEGKACAMAANSRHISRGLVVLALASLSSFGCTHAQLRRSTVAQSMTLSDIYTQQVLNNLAMFVQNPNALPFFAFPNQGTTSIQDTGSIAGPGYTAPNFGSGTFDLNASRQATENWVLVPVSDPAKLALMRCAYQQAIASTMGTPMNNGSGCPDCAALRSDFYGPKESTSGKLDPAGNLPCLYSPPWFTWGCEKHAKLPKQRACQTIGSYCGVYVCVPPECRDMLTRLTMTILDYAVNEPSQFETRTKQVALYLDALGKPTTQANSVRSINATIPIDQSSVDLLTLDKGVWSEFYKRFKKEDALNFVAAERARIAAENQQKRVQRDRVEAELKALESKPQPRAQAVETRITELKNGLRLDPALTPMPFSVLDAYRWWAERKPEQYPSTGPAPVAPGIVEFFRDHAVKDQILPQDTPSEELLTGPSTRQRKGNASGGLQAFQQQLKAASP
jgi:hypothetical protein